MGAMISKLAILIAKVKEELARVGQAVFDRVDRLTFGSLTVIQLALKSYSLVRAPEAAASMAYYALFSMFPLLLSLVSIGSYFMGSQQINSRVTQFVFLAFPVSSNEIIKTIEEVLAGGNRFTLVGVVGLIWSASAIFTIIFRNINRAWVQAKPLNMIKSRLVAIGSVGALGLLLILTLFAGAVLDLLTTLGLSMGDGESFFKTPLWLLLSAIIPVIVTFLISVSLYRWVPNTTVLWREAAIGALLVAVGMKMTTRFFTAYLSSGFAAYNLIYGSLGAIVALLFWVYLNSLIILFGAHLSAAVAHHTRLVPHVSEIQSAASAELDPLAPKLGSEIDDF